MNNNTAKHPLHPRQRRPLQPGFKTAIFWIVVILIFATAGMLYNSRLYEFDFGWSLLWTIALVVVAGPTGIWVLALKNRRMGPSPQTSAHEANFEKQLTSPEAVTLKTIFRVEADQFNRSQGRTKFD